MRATDGTMRIAAIQNEPSPLRAQVVSALTCSVLTIGTFLFLRRASGALAAPLPVSPLLATGLMLTAWAILVRELSRRNPVIMALLLLATLMFAVACSYPGARAIDWLTWPTVMFATVLLPSLPRTTDDDSEIINGFPVRIMSDKDEESDLVLQQVTRTRTAVGQETIHGQLLAEFIPGERQSTVYAAFCPPFERLPVVEVNVADDFDAAVKTTQLFHNGVQFEVRLAEPAENCFRLLIEFVATDSQPN